MDPNVRPRRGSGSIAWGIVLIFVGVVFLIGQLRPNFDPWRLVWIYWPVLLILLGLLKLWDHMRNRNNPQGRSSGLISGALITVIVIAILVGLSARHSGASNPTLHEPQPVELQGATSVTAKIDMGAGQINLDLTGERKQNFDVDVQGGVGEAKIRLPHDVGVEIRADGGIGSIDTEGLHKEGGRWVNEAWGKSPVTIHMNVEGGIGEIRLIVE